MPKKIATYWHYSVRWGLPHRPCPGPEVLGSAEVLAGESCPPEIARLHTLGSGYAVVIDFPPAQPIRRWSNERRAAARKRNLIRRVEKAAPLFAAELIQREIESRPEYFQGSRVCGSI